MISSVKTMGVRAAMLLCGTAILLGTAVAQDTTPPPPQGPGQMQGPPPGGGPGGRRGPDAERRVEMLQRRLNLSPDQTAQVRSLMAEERTKMEALRSNAALAPADRRSQMMAIHQDGETKLEALLTPDQKTKYAALQAQMRERMQERGGRGGPGGPGGPGQGDAPPPPPPPPAPQQ